MTQPAVRIPFVADDGLTGALVRQAAAAERVDRALHDMDRAAVSAARSVTATERATDDLADELDRAARKADDLADELDGVNRAGGQLDAQIAKTKRSIRELSEEFDRTGDQQLFGRLGQERGILANLQRIKKELADVGDDSGRGFTRGFFDALGALPAQLRGTMIIAAVGAAVAAGPLAAAALSGAVTAGLATGAVAGGIVAALQDQRVMTAGKDLATELKSDLLAAGQGFVDETLAGIEIIRAGWRGALPDIEATFRAAERHVGPLAEGVAGAFGEVAGGVRKVVEEADPVVEMLRRELPQLGRSAANAMEEFADHSEQSAAALKQVLDVTEMSVGALGEMAGFAAELYGWYQKTDGSLLTMLGHLDDAQPEKGFEGFGDAAARELDRVILQARLAGDAVDRLNSAFARAFDVEFDLQGSTVDYKLALMDLREELRNNGKTLDDSTAAGLRNQEILLRMIQRAGEVREATIAMGGGTQQATEAANAAYDSMIAQIYAVAKGAGVSTAALDVFFAKWKAAELLPKITKTLAVQFLADTSKYHPPPTAGKTLYFYDEGGEVGPGLPRGTPVPIVAHAGEVVLPEDLADRIMGLGGGTARPAAAALPTSAAAAPTELIVRVQLDIGGRDIVERVQKVALQEGTRTLQALFGLPPS